MPQLNPSPWFHILLLVWITLILFSTMKTSKHTHLNNPTNKSHLGDTHHSFSWPWL